MTSRDGPPEKFPERLNLPGLMARAFVESRLTVLLMIGLLFFGLVGLTFTPREENPQIIVPAAEVVIDFPGALPEEVEHRLLSPLEADLLSIDGVKNVYGSALDRKALVQIEFEVGEDKERALVRLYDRVFRFVLPTGAGQAYIRAIDVDDVPVFTLTLTSSEYDDYALRRMGERVVERLRSVKGVGQSNVVGGREREIRLETTPERLASFQLTLDQLASALRSADQSFPIDMRVDQDGHNHSLRLDDALRSAADIENVVVGAHDGRLVKIRDIAQVIDGPPRERNAMTRFAYGPASSEFRLDREAERAAVTVTVAKRTGVNAVVLTQALRERVASMREGFLPPGVELVVTRDDGIKADRTVTTLIEHLFIAIAAVTLVLWWSLGMRAATLVAITIPLVFALVLGMDLMAGPTLNRITLYALILALGMLVDDAIVVIENTHRHYAKLPQGASKEQRARAAIAAMHEVGNPTTLATFTVVAVFLSLSLVTGMLGEYFYPVTFNVPVAMIGSLVIAYSITPWLARRFLEVQGHSDEERNRLQSAYRKLFDLLLRRALVRRALYIVVGSALLLSLLQPAWQFVRADGISGKVSSLGVPLAFLPKDNKNTFLVHIHLPETTPLVMTDRAAREVGEVLRRHPEVVNYQTHVGYPAIIDFNGQLKGSAANIGPQFAEIRVNLTEKAQRNETSIEIVKSLRPAIEQIARDYPGGIIQLMEDPPGPPVRATVLAELYGPDARQLATLAKQVSGEFSSTYDMAEVWASVPYEVEEQRFRLRYDKVALAGVDPAQVGRTLRRMLAGGELGQIHPQGERQPVTVRLQIPRERRVEASMLAQAFATNSQGDRIPLSELVEIENSSMPTPIHHKNGERVHYVGGELADSAPVYAVLDLDSRLNGHAVTGRQLIESGNLGFVEERPSALRGYQLLWGGELRLTLDAFRDMGMALGLALVTVYLLLVGYYRSFALPMLAMTAVPLAFIGVFPGHWLFGQSFTAASMIGVIALAGVVVRNSLLLIDFAREYQAQGYSLDEAVREAGATRLRPILLTTLAIALGTAIMVPDPVFGGLALALIFGTLSSAFLSVFIVPLLYRRWASGPSG